MKSRHRVLTVRLSEADWDVVVRIADQRGFSRAEVGRMALMYGMKMLQSGHGFNLKRTLLLLEYIQAGMDLIITREYADFADKLLPIAQKRVDTYHA